jgi:hypothetical protein
MQYESQIETRGEIHTNEKHKQSGGNLRTYNEGRSQKEFASLRRRSSVALASFVAVPNATLAAGPQNHDQVAGFYRLKVGDLEVTALFDGPGVFNANWLNGQKTKDGALKALQDDPHLLDVADAGYLVNTGKQLILVDAGSGTWFGGGRFGHLVANLRSAGYTPEEVDIVSRHP